MSHVSGGHGAKMSLGPNAGAGSVLHARVPFSPHWGPQRRRRDAHKVQRLSDLPPTYSAHLAFGSDRLAANLSFHCGTTEGAAPSLGGQAPVTWSDMDC